MRPVLAALLILAAFSGTAAAAANDSPACDSLVRRVEQAPAGPVFLASYPDAPAGPLFQTAFLYDNAAAAIALSGCGRDDLARRLDEAILIALDGDRHWHDGRLRNAYAAGPVGPAPMKLPGWWDGTRNMWLEDRYQVGSDNGNMAWAMLALLTAGEKPGGERFLSAAQRIGTWVATFADTAGPGGYKGGTFSHEPDPSPLTWKSTEHNTDLFAAFSRLHAATGAPLWRDRAEAAKAFVLAMDRKDCACLFVGTGEDGVTPNPTLALDAELWPLLALPQMQERRSALVGVMRQRFSFGAGYAYAEVKDGVWTEGTAGVALLMRLSGNSDEARRLLVAVEAERAPDGGYFASSGPQLPTGFMLQTDPNKPRLYFHLSHLGATAWAALAQTGFNPFTGKPALP